MVAEPSSFIPPGHRGGDTGLKSETETWISAQEGVTALAFHHCVPSERPQSAQQDVRRCGPGLGPWELNGSSTLARDLRALAPPATFSVTFRENQGTSQDLLDKEVEENRLFKQWC